MIRYAAVLLMALSLPAVAQEATSRGTGAVVRGLDKITGVVTDLEIATGAHVRLGRITIALGECRYPPADPTGEGYAFMSIAEQDGTSVFQGWMVASSPALNPMDHARYDVWVLRCTTADGSSSSGTE